MAYPHTPAQHRHAYPPTARLSTDMHTTIPLSLYWQRIVLAHRPYARLSTRIRSTIRPASTEKATKIRVGA
eukprot:2006501-Rhodomonas_salina.3